MATLDEVTVSWIWTRAQPEKMALGDGTPNLSRQGTYTPSFNSAEVGTSWLRPWLTDLSFSKYWQASFGVNYPYVDAGRAWKAATPLAEGSPPTITSGPPGVTLTCQRYALPTSVAVVLTAVLQGPLDATDLMSTLQSLVNGNLSIKGAQPRPFTVALASLVDSLEQTNTGRSDSHAVGALRPTTIATVVKGTGWPSSPPVEGDATHRLLEALCRCSPAPLANGSPMPKLDDGLVVAADNFAETVRYASHDGVVIWSPARWASAGEHRLRCYHRNIVMSLLRADAMIHAVQWASTQAVMTQDVTELVRICVVQLSLQWGNANDVYRSEVVRRHIEEAGAVPAINALRTSLNVGPALT